MNFEERISKAIRDSIKECRYRPQVFMQMRDDHGTIEAIKRLLHSREMPSGFVKLWELQRMDLTLEAIILEEDWKDLFTEEERTIAKNRLRQYGYTTKSK